MNGQSRGEKPNYEKLNIIKMVEIIEDYAGYKRILFLRPFANTYMGYLDDDFFGFSVPESNQRLWLMEARPAVDYYRTKVPFHIPSLEYDTFIRKSEFKKYVNALVMKKKGLDGKKK